jgi:SAM-dependent methyltransferase
VVSETFYLPGGDDISSTVLCNDEILRIYRNPESFREAVSILNIIQGEPRLNGLVVPTTIQNSAQENFTLQHDTLSFNLPENWTLNQYVEVVEAHLELLRILAENGLTLKDHLPENFVLNQGNPVFVDFGSIVKKSARNQIPWINQLRGDKSVEKYLISELMFPFLLLPLFVGLINSEKEMRQILKFEYCNSGLPALSRKRISFKNLFFAFSPSISFKVCLFLLSKKFFKSEIKTLSKGVQLSKLLLSSLNRTSNYLDYYKKKDEEFDLDDPRYWNDKQITVRNLISREKPKDILDLGCNTGWFSLLATKNNCKVKAIDIDSVIVDHLHLQAKREHLPIEPSVLDFETLAFFKGITLSDNDLSSTCSRKLPKSSYDADLVLALGLIHHLVLGLGYSLERVMELLSSLARETLVLEFVSLNDDKILSEQDFFPAFNQSKSSYTKENVIIFGLNYFEKVEVFPSNPDTREILVFGRS